MGAQLFRLLSRGVLLFATLWVGISGVTMASPSVSNTVVRFEVIRGTNTL